jgi:hypothetical protein
MGIYMKKTKIIKWWFKRKLRMVRHPIFFYIIRTDEDASQRSYEIGELSYRYFRKNDVFFRKHREEGIKYKYEQSTDVIPSKFKRWILCRKEIKEMRQHLRRDIIRRIFGTISNGFYQYFGKGD